MNLYHFRLYVGPTMVSQAAAALRGAATPWQSVTVEGTEHVHFSTVALFEQAARDEADRWAKRAGFARAANDRLPGVELLRSESGGEVTHE